MRRNYRITKHGKRRIAERTNFNYKGNYLTRIVSRNGKSKGMYQGAFHQYLTTKSKNGSIVKVYQGNIYILSKNSRRLITTYSIPEKYMPVEQYEIKSKREQIITIINNNLNKQLIIELKTGNVFKGIVLNPIDLNDEDITNFTLVMEDKSLMIISFNNIKSIEIENITSTIMV